MPYIKYIKPLTVQDVSLKIENAIVDNKAIIKILPVVLPILKKWDGKKLNIRLAKQVKEAIGEGYNVHCGPHLLWYELTIYGSKMYRPNPSDKYRFLLHYDDMQYFSWDWFKVNQLFWNIERLTEQNEKYMKLNGRIPVLVQRWNMAIAELQSINAEVENSPVEFAPFFDINT